MAAVRSMPPIQYRCSLVTGLGHLKDELLNRLDVSKYYVIRTIIISDISVEGYESLSS
jgi:hypothetical protein